MINYDALWTGLGIVVGLLFLMAWMVCLPRLDIHRDARPHTRLDTKIGR